MMPRVAPRRILPAFDRRFWAGLAAFVLLIAAIIALVDRPLHQAAMALPPTWQQVFLAVTEIGNSTWSILAGLILVLAFRLIVWRSRGRKRLIARRLQGMAALLLLSVLASGISVSLLKNGLGRARPNTHDPAHLFDFAPFTFDAAWASFPSGHSTTAMTVAVVACLLAPRLSPLWLALGFTGALSRVILGVHWPSDALAGCAYGAICTLALAQGFANRGWVFSGRRRVFSARLWRGLFR